MKNFYLLLLSVLILTSCNQKKVTVYGNIKGLKSGEVILLKRAINQSDLKELSRAQIENGDFKLQTEELVLPARVWVEFPNGYRAAALVDTKDKTFVQSIKGHYNQTKVYGSGIGKQYDNVKSLMKEKYEDPMSPILKAINKIKAKTKQSKDNKVMLGLYELQIQRYKRYRANYSTKLIEQNLGMDLSMFLLYDELKDSTELREKLLPKLMIKNKECDIYKLLESEINK